MSMLSLLLKLALDPLFKWNIKLNYEYTSINLATILILVKAEAHCSGNFWNMVYDYLKKLCGEKNYVVKNQLVIIIGFETQDTVKI